MCKHEGEVTSGVSFPVQHAQKPAIRDRDPWLPVEASPPLDTGGGMWSWAFSDELQKLEDGSLDTVAGPMTTIVTSAAAEEETPLYPQRNVKRD